MVCRYDAVSSYRTGKMIDINLAKRLMDFGMTTDSAVGLFDVGNQVGNEIPSFPDPGDVI